MAQPSLRQLHSSSVVDQLSSHLSLLHWTHSSISCTVYDDFQQTMLMSDTPHHSRMPEVCMGGGEALKAIYTLMRYNIPIKVM